MGNYAPSTRERISDLVDGMRVETGTFAAATYVNHTTNTGQFELFQVNGVIRLMGLYVEAITVFGAGAAVVSFTYTSSSPVVAVAEICDACASVATLAEGTRIVWPGGVVATAAIITASAGITDVSPSGSEHLIGTYGGTGTIGMLTATATIASGTARAFLSYVPKEKGAYVVANTLPQNP